MSKIIVVSNRLPVTIDKKDGELHFHPSAGGLATGLNSLDKEFDKLWIGWPGEAIDDALEQHAIIEKFAEDKMAPVFLTAEEIEDYYEGFSNETIWPHFHYFTQYTDYSEEGWEAYKQVNQKFADVVCTYLEDDMMVWVHDYQLLLVPSMIRKRFPQASIGFFLHIPFPSYEIFRILPWRREILEGVLGADLIGFHTYDYMRHFLSAVYRINGYEHNFGGLMVGDRVMNVDVFPMGIDYNKYAFYQPDPEKVNVNFTFGGDAKEHKLIISIDRLDYTKGIPQRIRAFGRFLKENPQHHQKVTLVLLVVPSRSNVEQYQELKEDIDTLVGGINGEYGTFDWIPIRYFYRSFSFDDLCALYRRADIAMITPLRDGMNLVAKEFVASKQDKKGVLILSEMAGAASVLTEALIINPHDERNIMEALEEALVMPAAEQAVRLEAMQRKLRKYTVMHWAKTFINQQKKVEQLQNRKLTKLLGKEDIQGLKENYVKAEQRLLLLDYDGTLMGFRNDPTAVKPDEELLNMVQALLDDERNKVVLISGRDHKTLDKWFGHFANLDMAAEHGVWLKREGVWKASDGLTKSWKKKVREILESLVERTPGSFIEEKDYSIVWHYRTIDKELGEKRIREFRDVLLYLTANLDLQVLEGNKVVEIKNAGVNKGKATRKWLGKKPWDFVLAIGDDSTDEDTFEAVGSKGYTVKVGLDRTAAQYSILSVEEVRALLKSFMESKVAVK